ncbi:MAG: hypothetical protein AB7L09_03525, partial [Nitrospira sp.]
MVISLSAFIPAPETFDLGGDGSLGNVTISTQVVASGAEIRNYNDLTITGTGELICGAGEPLWVKVRGNLLVQTGGSIHANGRGPGTSGAGGAGSDGAANSLNGTAGSPASLGGITASGGGGGGGSGGDDGSGGPPGSGNGGAGSAGTNRATGFDPTGTGAGSAGTGGPGV